MTYNFKRWFDHYSQWKNDCICSLIMQGYDIAHNGHNIEINEDGSVLLEDYTEVIENMVTTWKNSEYFTP